MFGGKLGLPELLVIVAIALLIFGPKKLGELGKGLGEGIRNFKSSMNDNNAATNATTTRPRTRPQTKTRSHSQRLCRLLCAIETPEISDHHFRRMALIAIPQSSVRPVVISAARNMRYTLGTGNPTTLK